VYGLTAYGEPMEGTPFGRYRLIELLGRGGMGEVWRAYDTAIDRVVALKLLPANFADDRVFQERFRREAKAAAGLDEPHVVPIHDFGEIEGRLYVTMRLIDGRDLQTVLAEGPLAPERAVRIIEQVAKALHAAHRIGLIHRDIKPSNILLAEDDFAYLIDFGIARAAGETGLTSTGATIGTWSYMSPERFQSGTADARADIYALACVLYQALTGRPPFPGDTLEQIAVAHMLAPPPRPSEHGGVPAAMNDVIATGMAKNPAERYATTVELARAAHDATTAPFSRPVPTVAVPPSSRRDQPAAGLIHGEHTQLAVAGDAPVWQPPSGPPPPWAQPTPQRPMWRRPRIVIPALLAVVVLIGGGVFAAVKASKLHNQPASAAPAAAQPAAAPPAAAAPNTGPFTGTYAADFGAGTDLDGKPLEGATPATETWGLRSACPSSGCIATTSRRSGQTTNLSTLVFDNIGGRWVAVGVSPGTCLDVPAEVWEVFTLQPRPDGTFSGEFTTTNSNGCASKRAVTFTRTGDVDITSLPDPATQPPRVVSPAEALHGQYHHTRTLAATGEVFEFDIVFRTDCLRTGDRCMSNGHSPPADDVPLVFSSGKWVRDTERGESCRLGATGRTKRTTIYPLPAPPQDPITLLTGHGNDEVTGSACVGSDFDDKFVRTGD
jgi:predicted Ser/Thr protein kinase